MKPRVEFSFLGLQKQLEHQERFSLCAVEQRRDMRKRHGSLDPEIVPRIF